MKIGRRLFGIFTAALVGYIWGWIAGWTFFDPNLDLWALLAAVGAVVGLVAGLAGLFQRWEMIILCATLGLYLGFVARAWLFGDVPGGWGGGLALFCALLGGVSGRRLAPGSRRILLTALYTGFFGGFLIDIVLLDLSFGVVRQHSVAHQGVLVIVCAVVGGLAVTMTRPAAS